MKLLRLSLSNFRGVPNGRYELTHPQSGEPLDLVVITGPNGSGKTRLLEAIIAAKESVGAYAARLDPISLIHPGMSEGSIEATWKLSDDEVRRSGLPHAIWATTMKLGPNAAPPSVDPGLAKLFAQYLHQPVCGKLEYFPANRHLFGARAPGIVPPLSEKAEARMRVGAEPSKYASIYSWLIGQGLRDIAATADQVATRGLVLKHDLTDSLAGVKRSVAALAPHLRLIGIRLSAEGHGVIFRHVDGADVELNELSDGERQAVLFAAAFERIQLHGSMVLIDHPELFVHPFDHVRALRTIAALGKDNQVIVTTTSQAILGNVARHETIQLKHRAPYPSS